MRLIAHRTNTIAELQALSDDCAIEFDLRDSNCEIIVTHDPFTTGPRFADFAQHLGQRFCIVNIKSEGIEWKVLDILNQNGIEDFFFLDCSIPMIHKLVQSGEHRIAVRYSEYEPLESVLRWRHKVRWVWVDSFRQFQLSSKDAQSIDQANMQLCLVSPELQGRPNDIEHYIQLIQDRGLKIDAVCTKVANFSRWLVLL
jgi:hypothetical protein